MGPFLSRNLLSSENCPGRCSTRTIRRTLKYVSRVDSWAPSKNGEIGSLSIGTHAIAFT